MPYFIDMIDWLLCWYTQIFYVKQISRWSKKPCKLKYSIDSWSIMTIIMKRRRKLYVAALCQLLVAKANLKHKVKDQNKITRSQSPRREKLHVVVFAGT